MAVRKSDGSDRYMTIEEYKNSNISRLEVYDGEPITMDAPNHTHQRIVSVMGNQIYNYIQSHNGKCEVEYSSSVHEKKSNKLDDETNPTYVQPDILVQCDFDRDENDDYLNPPSLVIEVLSPSTKKFDLGRKKNIYKNIGVKEYWVVDGDNKKIYCYLFETNENSIYPLSGKVKVGIYEDLYIDCDDILKRMSK